MALRGGIAQQRGGGFVIRVGGSLRRFHSSYWAPFPPVFFAIKTTVFEDDSECALAEMSGVMKSAWGESPHSNETSSQVIVVFA
jgi:hypothetical protein